MLVAHLAELPLRDDFRGRGSRRDDTTGIAAPEHRPVALPDAHTTRARHARRVPEDAGPRNTRRRRTVSTRDNRPAWGWASSSPRDRDAARGGDSMTAYIPGSGSERHHVEAGRPASAAAVTPTPAPISRTEPRGGTSLDQNRAASSAWPQTVAKRIVVIARFRCCSASRPPGYVPGTPGGFSANHRTMSGMCWLERARDGEVEHSRTRVAAVFEVVGDRHREQERTSPSRA